MHPSPNHGTSSVIYRICKENYSQTNGMGWICLVTGGLSSAAITKYAFIYGLPRQRYPFSHFFGDVVGDRCRGCGGNLSYRRTLLQGDPQVGVD